MSHPMKSEVSGAMNAKMHRMTSGYGAASGAKNNIMSPQERLKGEAGEKSVGFGADSDNAGPARGDKAARRTTTANPVATYARGGKVKHRDAGGDVSPIEEANKNQADAAPKAAGGVIARARGGRAKHGATHVNVMVAPQGGGVPSGMPMGGPSPQLAALAGAHPPMGGPPPGGPPMMPPPGPGGPPGMPPGAPPMRARGGKVMGDHPDESQDKDLIQKTLKEEGLVRKARGGGIHMTAGAVTGQGRLEKMGMSVPKEGAKVRGEI